MASSNIESVPTTFTVNVFSAVAPFRSAVAVKITSASCCAGETSPASVIKSFLSELQIMLLPLPPTEGRSRSLYTESGREIFSKSAAASLSSAIVGEYTLKPFRAPVNPGSAEYRDFPIYPQMSSSAFVPSVSIFCIEYPVSIPLTTSTPSTRRRMVPFSKSRRTVA